jgi:hypothetical protein
MAKELPHPHDDVALGFIILKVFSINFSEKSRIEPSIKAKEDLSIKTFSKIRSSSFIFISVVKLYL